MRAARHRIQVGPSWDITASLAGFFIVEYPPPPVFSLSPAPPPQIPCACACVCVLSPCVGSAAKMLGPFSAVGDATSPVAMTASAIFSPNPRGIAPPLDSPLLLKRSLGSPAPPISMTASAIFSPNPGAHRGGGGGREVLSHLTESPAAIKGTDLRQAASAESDTPPKSKPPTKKSRRSLPPAAAVPPRDIPPPEPVPPPPAGRTRRTCTNYGADASPDT